MSSMNLSLKVMAAQIAVHSYRHSFALVSTHGLHVTTGLVWIIIMMIQVSRRGLTDVNRTRLSCFLSLFWHFP